jgi:hypothetical protein
MRRLTLPGAILLGLASIAITTGCLGQGGPLTGLGQPGKTLWQEAGGEPGAWPTLALRPDPRVAASMLVVRPDPHRAGTMTTLRPDSRTGSLLLVPPSPAGDRTAGSGVGGSVSPFRLGAAADVSALEAGHLKLRLGDPADGAALDAGRLKLRPGAPTRP